MNFQNLSRIEKPEFYINNAIQESLKSAASLRTSPSMRGHKKDLSARIEEKKVIIFIKILTGNMDRIEKSFPSIDNLPVFYQELIQVTISKDDLKKSINTLNWIKRKAVELSKMTLAKINRAKNITEINKARKELFGRVNSLLERRKKEFDFLENSRKKMKNFPSIKEGMINACLCGYPNVGKSTLLSKLTTARPEINVYPFTTKAIMIGYISGKAQIIDAPGTFSSDFLKMNTIEKQAYLAIKLLADVIVFVFDLSESCGYEIDLQEALMDQIKNKFKSKKFVIYLSKTDLIKQELIDDFKNKYKNEEIIDNIEKLKMNILSN